MIHIFLDSVRGQVDDSFVIALSCIWARTLTLVKKGFIIWPTFAISVFIGTEVGFCETRLNINFSAGGEGGGGGGVLLGILGGGVPLGSSNPDPISDQKMFFPHPFSDFTSKIYACT